MTKDLDALAAEIEAAFRPDYGYCLVSPDSMRALLAERKQMKAALEFYADPKTYDPEPIEQARARTGGDPTTGVQRGTLRYQAGSGFAIPPIVADQNGYRARAALNPAGKDT